VGQGARVAGPVPNAEANAATCVSLPMFPELTAEEIDYVISKVKEWDAANASKVAAQKTGRPFRKNCSCSCS